MRSELRLIRDRERAAHDLGQGVDEQRVVVRHLDPVEPQAELPRLVLRLRVDVPADLQMIRHEPDGADQHVLDAAAAQGFQVVEDVGTEPRLAGRRLALEGERPVLDTGAVGDEPGGLEQLILVGVTLGEDARRK